MENSYNLVAMFTISTMCIEDENVTKKEESFPEHVPQFTPC